MDPCGEAQIQGGIARSGVSTTGEGSLCAQRSHGQSAEKLSGQLWVQRIDEGHSGVGREGRLTVLWPFTTMKPCLIWLTSTGQVLWLVRSMSRSHTSAWQVPGGERSAHDYPTATQPLPVPPGPAPSPGPHATGPPLGCPPHSSPHSLRG